MPTVKMRKMTDKEMADRVAKENAKREGRKSNNPYGRLFESMGKKIKGAMK